MTLEKLRVLCLSFPGATEQIQWGADLVFKVGGKMFCVACTEPVSPLKVVLSFKCDDEAFAELIEVEGAIPAPYLARAKWVALESFATLPDRELTPLVRRAYEIVRDKLPAKAVAALTRVSKDTTSAYAAEGRYGETSPKPARKLAGAGGKGTKKPVKQYR